MSEIGIITVVRGRAWF